MNGRRGWRARKDGSRFSASVVITALTADDGSLIGFAKVTRDLTARRIAALELRMRERQLRDTQELAGLGSREWDELGLLRGHTPWDLRGPPRFVIPLATGRRTERENRR